MSSAPETSPESPKANRYKDTLNLPKTSFGMKANLVQNEPASIKAWDAMGLYEKAVAAREIAGSPAFVFHDGPPYANGNLHIGHLLNKCLKDFVVRSKQMSGKVCRYVPGWDCHGLPIEHKVMTELAEAGKLAKVAGLPEDQRRMAIRRECQKHAEKFQKLQSGQLKRFLAIGDYEHPYMTMSKGFEAATLGVFADLVEQGLVYRQLKAVHWSIANETALADAELEYYDREDTSVYVDFEAADPDKVYDAFGLEELNAEDAEDSGGEDGGDDAAGATGTEDTARGPQRGRPGQRPCFMIWTTTPWTLPANLAIAVNPGFEYALVHVDGNVTIIARELVEKVTKAGKAQDVRILATARGDKLLGLRYRHPFINGQPDFSKLPGAAMPGGGGSGAASSPPEVYRVVGADYVTLEDGTGLVHTAPGHGAEDYMTGVREKLPIYCPVLPNGAYDDSAPESLRGKSIWDANKLIVEMLRASGHLFYDHTFTHSYPHDWRGKSPVIFRATEQWFVGVDRTFRLTNDPKTLQPTSIRDRALFAVQAWPMSSSNKSSLPPGLVHAGKMDAIYSQELVEKSELRFTPLWGKNRLLGMLENRPDWCISRQRSWGLPIPAFYAVDAAGRATTTLLTPASVRAVARRIEEAGSDAWFLETPEQILRHYDYAADADAPRGLELGSLKKSSDIFDVWFESGCSWSAVIEKQCGQKVPTDLYLEGSDQHRGWFQVSLLTCLGARGTPPYKRLLTHGFIVDKDGRKMSKSVGNTIEVEDLMKEFGADVCRWWAATVDYTGDIRADKSFFVAAGEAYRKVRNTLRFMLSNLDDYSGTGVSTTGVPPVSQEPSETNPERQRAGSSSSSSSSLDTLSPTSLEAWVLGEYNAMSAQVRNHYEQYDFRAAAVRIYDFCNDTLSSVYLAAIKDRLYCDKPDSARRRSTQAALWSLTDALCRLLAPIMPHTADEAWRALNRLSPGSDASVHLKNWIESFSVGTEVEGWKQVMAAREAGLKALEAARQSSDLDNPLDAGVTLPDASGVLQKFDAVDLADLMGVSHVSLSGTGVPPVVVTDLRSQPRCERSWKRDGTVKQRSDGGMLSDRDAAAVGVG